MGVVHKYGGSSVATVEKIKSIAKHIVEIKNSGEDIAVVVSAMGKTTNELIATAKEISQNPNARELDSLMSIGEQKTITLLAMAIHELGVPAISLTGFQCGFLTNNNHNYAKIVDIDDKLLKKYVAEGYVPVIAGFQGIDQYKNITTLGRGGSDTTAVAIAAKLGWDCEIYTDVDGIYTVDPRVCPGSKKLSEITYDEMMEMASLGAGVLETRSVELAKKFGVRLLLAQSLEKDKTKGTYIMEQTNFFEEMPITGISISKDVSMLTIKGLPADGEAVDEIFKAIAELDVNVDMISQQISDDNTVMLSFSCSHARATELVKKFADFDLPYRIVAHYPLTKISLVGVGMITHSGIASKAFTTLFGAKINYYQVTTSEISISMTIDSDNTEKAVAVLADAFGLRN